MIATKRSMNPTEEARLDRAIASMDPALKASLQRDQRLRHTQLAIFGGIFMFATITLVSALFAGSLLFSGDQKTVDDAVESERLTEKGYKLWQSGRHADAVKRFEQALELDPQNANAYNGLGWANLNQGLTTPALSAFKKSVKLNPNQVASWNGIGQANLSLGNLEEAEKALLNAKAAPAAWMGLLKVNLLKGDFDEAEVWYDKVANSPAGMQGGLDHIRKAIENRELSDDLKRQFTPPPTSKVEGVNEMLAKANQLLNSGKFRPAQLAFELILEKDPDFNLAKVGVGYSRLHQGQHEEAISIFEELLQDPHTSIAAANGKAMALRHSGNVSAAIKTWKELGKKPGGEMLANSSLGTLLFQQGEYAEAVPYLEALAKAMPANQQFASMLKEAKSKVDAENE